MGEGNTAGTRVELYARETLPSVAQKRRERVADRLRDLTGDGCVSAVEVSSWPKTVPTDGTGHEADRYEEFSAWADERAVSLAPFFETRQCYSPATGEKGWRLVLPALCLAVYRDGDLRCVYPHSTNDGSRSVMDGLRAIESARRTTVPETGLQRSKSD